VTVVVDGAQAESVVARWTPKAGGTTTSTALVSSGPDQWQGVVQGIATQQENVLTVRVRTTDGVTVTTPGQPFDHICPG
jgi:hypothetical protein